MIIRETLYGGTGKNLTFDPENRMTVDTRSGSTLLSAGYRYDGLRAWKQNGSGTRTYFLYDQARDIVCELTSAGGVQAEDTFGPMGLIERSGPTGTAATGLGFFGFDPSGNDILRLTTSGSVTTSCLFDSFGSRVANTGSTTPYPFAFGGEQGGYSDTESSYVLFQHRYFDTNKARWLNRDPVGFDGGMNPYGYVGNDLTADTDSSGFSNDGAPWYDKLKSWADGHIPQGSPFNPVSGSINGALHALLDLPSNTGHLGTGTGAFFGNPSLSTAPGLAQDVGTAATWLTLGYGAAGGAGGAAVSTETTEGASTIPDVAYHYTSTEAADSIEVNGLNAGQGGTVYLTPDGTLSPIQAQLNLALNPNSSANALFQVDVAGLRNAGYDISDTNTVARLYNMPGGGQEFQVTAATFRLSLFKESDEQSNR